MEKPLFAPAALENRLGKVKKGLRPRIEAVVTRDADQIIDVVALRLHQCSIFQRQKPKSARSRICTFGVTTHPLKLHLCGTRA